jgi:DNA-3-methyladenine glycosylase
VTALPRAFFARDPRELAPDLLNKLLVAADGRAGRIVEVEAYLGAIDPAAHSARGPTPRTASMFGPPGHLYVYRSYGLHWCANVVGGSAGEGVAVLLRALRPVAGLEAMRAARAGSRRDLDLCRGPGRLCQAMAIEGSHDGLDLLAPASAFAVVDDGVAPPAAPAATVRIGISVATDRPWRWHVADEPHVSGPRRLSAGPGG